MQTYRIRSLIYISSYADVEAKSLDQAKEKAENLEYEEYTLDPDWYTEIQPLTINFEGNIYDVD